MHGGWRDAACLQFLSGTDTALILAGPNLKPAREKLIVGSFARLRPSVTLEKAQNEVAALHRTLHRADAEERYGVFCLRRNIDSRFTSEWKIQVPRGDGPPKVRAQSDKR